ncbi:hypothetical protein ACKKBG_A26640 [Auxenochlorella protothecoides x Auxenochlorella symbiontica]
MFGHRSLPAQHCGCNQGSMHVQVLLPSIRHIRAACIRPHCHERGPYCRELGYSKQGAIRTATLQNLGLSVGAINLTPFATVKACSTEILVGVECLKPGQTACTADANGNIGTGNKGKDNFGSNNVGDHNIGTTNSENYIWANNNTEYGLRRNDATGTRKEVPAPICKEVASPTSPTIVWNEDGTLTFTVTILDYIADNVQAWSGGASPTLCSQ